MTIDSSSFISGVIVGLIGRAFIMKQIIARIVAWFSGDVIKKIISCLPVIVVEIEKAMVDGKITSEERKNIAMKAMDTIAEKFNIKVSGIMRWVISVIIDNIAKKLPKDIKIPDIILSVTKEF